MHRSRWLLPFLLLAPWWAQAATSPVKLTTKPTASVANSCVIKSLDNISLGAYSPISGLASTGSGQLQLTCTKGTAVTASPTSGGNTLRGGNGSLTYALYTDAGMTSFWGQGDTRTFATTVTTDTQFSTILTEAQFLANPDYAKGFYVREVGTRSPRSGGATTTVTLYYVGYLGQSGSSLPGRAVSVFTPTVYATNSSNDLFNVLPGESTNNWSQQSITVNANKSMVSTYGSGNSNTYNYTVTTQFLVPPGSVTTNPTFIVPTGNGTALKGTASSAKTAVAMTYYAKVPSGQDVVAGTYTDTVTVQVTF